MVDESDTDPEEVAMTIPEFIASVLKSAKEQKESDHELLDILSDSVVTLEESKSSTAKALQDIEALAESRASAEPVADGNDDCE